ncbi:MAG: hypothetical protein A2498_00120 [Lentisphaerae bacterium RIFOXYC12_FULL_60_16]|nr:MAG: hypothetical protein A2498_00120 [Lentisphaerae bacterium RIFOXYC12_FULL_60_16]OGV73015.1 MAG: hypothetical protein A2269_04695 [Lentisphaerae bacterium RIFOXYA12_FULL_60_10]OGV84739.1 MAG: hypothetical protein A2340_04240 [Lentisphaerae bacterium RIFOXYB12_FULL_60_10]
MTGKGNKPLSLVSRGTRVQFVIGAVLTSVIPLLSTGFLLSPLRETYGLDHRATTVFLICTTALVTLGFVMLLRYPINVIRLRRFLESLAAGNLPDPATIALIRTEDDMAAIEDCMVDILRQTTNRVQMIQHQADILIQAETHRAMIASLGAACHHLGQPVTVITMCLDLIDRQEHPAEIRALVEQAKTSVHELGAILERLRSVAEFRTEPYLVSDSGDVSRSDEYILMVPKGSVEAYRKPDAS